MDSEATIREVIMRCFRCTAADTVGYLGPDASVTQILEKLNITFCTVALYDVQWEIFIGYIKMRLRQCLLLETKLRKRLTPNWKGTSFMESEKKSDITNKQVDIYWSFSGSQKAEQKPREKDISQRVCISYFPVQEKNIVKSGAAVAISLIDLEIIRKIQKK